MREIIIRGGRPLEGSLDVQGAKNSVLPILAAAVLHPGQTVLRHCPRISDVAAAAAILRHLGCLVRWEGEELVVDASRLSRWDIPDHMMREMRSSVIFLGAVLARLGWAEISYPGGCELGPRPIDLHLAALGRLGAHITEKGGSLVCAAQHLRGAEITLPIPSVGATENAILCACGAEGESVIYNAAREPEIRDLQAFLRTLGFRVRGAGTSTVCVGGRAKTRDADHAVMPDRIAAATWLCAAAAAGGRIELTNVNYRHLSTVTAALHEAGCRVRGEEGRIELESTGRLRSIGPVRTAPYPGFPTDAQAILMAALAGSRGATVFVETMFSSRYRHVDELRRMGADISVADRVAVVTGVESLHGARVRCTDLRGGAALLVAALGARGTTYIEDIRHILRGYDHPVETLAKLGADAEMN